MFTKKQYIIAGALATIVLAAGGWLVWQRHAQAQEVVPPPVASSVFIEEKDNTLIVYVQGRKMGEFKKAADVEKLRVLRQAGTALYLGVYPPVPPDSYSLFDTPAPRVFQFDILNHSNRFIAREGLLIGDISPDGRYVAWLKYDAGGNQLILEDLQQQAQQELALPAEFSQFGDILFSPDGHSVVVAAAVGFPERERGAVYALSRGSSELEEIAASKGENTYIRIRGWKSAKTPLLEEVSAP